MKKINGTVMKKGLSVVLATTLVCGSTGIWSYTKTAQDSEPVSEAQTEEVKLNKVSTENTELSEKDMEQLSKEETVYVIANADGSTQKLIVSDWLKNALGSDQISDTTELTDITNVKGDESFQAESDNVDVWDAQGNDIYYQGSIEKELPVDMKISYKLDGASVTPEELAGKSGKVTIRFDYTNRQKETVTVGDKEEELYVPFAVVTGFMVDNDNFSNIEVSNGRVINDGERSIIMGYALPGLKDNLDIDSENFDLDDIELPEYVEVTADVTDFELATTLTVATNDIFADMDTDVQDSLDDLKDDMNELTDAMEELMDGTSDLYDGVLELYDGTEELTDGIDELNDGARELRDGASELYDGTGTLKTGVGQLVLGASKLETGLKQLTANNSALNAGAEQVFATLLSTVETQLTSAGIKVPTTLTKDNYKTVLDGIVDNLLATGTAAIQGVNPAAQTLTRENYASVINAILGSQMSTSVIDVESSSQSMQAGSIVDENQTPETSESETPGTETDPVVEEIQKEVTMENPEEDSTEVQSESQARVQAKEFVMVGGSNPSDTATQLQTLEAGITQILAAESSLDEYATFYKGLVTYTGTVETLILPGVQELLAGAKKLDSGASSLKTGAGKLKDGAAELKDGTGELKDGGQELKDGVAELRDGSLELKDGVVELNDEGIQKLADMVNGDAQELADRFEGTKAAAKAYKSFAGISDGMDGKVKFIYKTAAIEAE
jgi:putative membrane protein